MAASSCGRAGGGNENIGQPIDYSKDKMVPIQKMTLGSLQLPRIDFIKIDVEGMEIEALEGALQSIKTSCPILLIESIKAGHDRLRAWLESAGYKVMKAGINFVAIHLSDPTLNHIKINAPPEQSSAA